MTDEEPAPVVELRPTFDVSKPHSARMWNYWLGGKDNFRIDREAGANIARIFPQIIDVARASRGLLSRVVEHLAGEVGVRQFLDIGTGLPTANNTHEVAQRIAPECRVVYVDNDPLVLVHARALLVGSEKGATDYIDADVHDPGKILDRAAETLDFSQPIGLVMFGIMGNVHDDTEARAVVKRLVGAIPSGSYLALNDGTTSDARAEARRRLEATGARGYQAREPEEIARFFDGLELIEPGCVSTPLWRPIPCPDGPPAPIASYCGVAAKP